MRVGWGWWTSERSDLRTGSPDSSGMAFVAPAVDCSPLSRLETFVKDTGLSAGAGAAAAACNEDALAVFRGPDIDDDEEEEEAAAAPAEVLSCPALGEFDVPRAACN